ncbi:glycosyl transferase 4-like domain protein [Mycobacterium xenopi 4042]|uniref:Glycosyl transferase 4-like domain protein n=1 Tax=Mycobacterium xenopi 4042 TaxID=1299334 RepID=X8DJU4_MYCXE|nr:glycosyl transferase 4-like domain protein [Mycobacterium xenopi 4042]
MPLVHTAHTLAAVKNAALAEGDTPEPPLRTVGEQQVVDEADRLIVNTNAEAGQLVSLHSADPSRIDVAHPGWTSTCSGPVIAARPGPRWGCRSTSVWWPSSAGFSR